MTRHPSPAEILAARRAAGLTQSQAARLINLPPPRWSEYETGKVRMSWQMWRLFRLLVGQEDLPDNLR